MTEGKTYIFDCSVLHTEHLLQHREEARNAKNWQQSDEIRDELDKRGVFIIDTKNGYETYYRPGTRKQLLEDIAKDIRAEKRFDSWLYSVNQSIK